MVGGAASIDLGKMIAKYKEKGEGRGLEQFVRDELSAVADKRHAAAGHKGTDVVLYGFGRIGRMVFRAVAEDFPNIEVVGINGSGDTNTNAHLLEYDSMLGPLRNAEVTTTEDTIVINGKTINKFKDPYGTNIE